MAPSAERPPIPCHRADTPDLRPQNCYAARLSAAHARVQGCLRLQLLDAADAEATGAVAHEACTPEMCMYVLQGLMSVPGRVQSLQAGVTRGRLG